MTPSAKFFRKPARIDKRLEKVYLCGPMDQVTEGQSVLWRKKATLLLARKKIKVEDPTNRVNLPAWEIVDGDKEAIRECQCLLAHTPKGIPFVGTSMEIFYASQVLGIPVIAWGGGNSTTPSPWIKVHSTFICDSLEQALAFIFDSLK